ncbi:Biofilm regulator 1 [Cyphellophora attinorum]|uniref:Biofilm regulator 1 n=1 Tax=Cyphellophora attinorum TaxID=1664694 RepID=A0A0N1H8E8_9EURO|nr:Biofilm regulator 1 [Phialophora attinorum]KPI39595.1 Biofilm regulator 1 [Phialophora attinorum]
MATVDSVDRQRPALPSISHLDLDKMKVERPEGRFPSINAINTSAPPLGSPNAPYTGPPPPYSYHNGSNGPSQPGYISPPESTTRNPRDEVDKVSPRKSLPSIHEALRENKDLPPLSTATNSGMPSTPSTTISQHFPEGARGPSNPFSAPSFRDTSFSSQLPPSTLPAESRPKDVYSTQPPPQSPRSNLLPSFHSGPTIGASSTFSSRTDLPQAPPRSPDMGQSRHSFQSLPRPPPSAYRDEPYQFSGSPATHETRVLFDRAPDATYENTIKRHIGVHEAAKELSEIREISARNADIAHNWTQRYHQGNRSGFFQDSLPDLSEIDDMIRHSQMMTENLARMREVVIQQQNALSDHRARFARPPGEEEYHNRQESYDPNGYGLDAKKRRGKAAPPGRCHSCNRAETPEWRRGPDGARTLCNACGLHYAKLTRKVGAGNASKIRGSDIRPKNHDLGHP